MKHALEQFHKYMAAMKHISQSPHRSHALYVAGRVELSLVLLLTGLDVF